MQNRFPVYNKGYNWCKRAYWDISGVKITKVRFPVYSTGYNWCERELIGTYISGVKITTSQISCLQPQDIIGVRES